MNIANEISSSVAAAVKALYGQDVPEKMVQLQKTKLKAGRQPRHPHKVSRPPAAVRHHSKNAPIPPLRLPIYPDVSVAVACRE